MISYGNAWKCHYQICQYYLPFVLEIFLPYKLFKHTFWIFLADWQPKIRGLGCIDPKGICQDFAPFALRPPKFRIGDIIYLYSCFALVILPTLKSLQKRFRRGFITSAGCIEKRPGFGTATWHSSIASVPAPPLRGFMVELPVLHGFSWGN